VDVVVVGSDVVDVVEDVVVLDGGGFDPALVMVKADGDVTTGSYPTVPFALTFSRIATETIGFTPSLDPLRLDATVPP